MIFGWRPFVKHLQDEVAWLRAEVRYHTQRADRALDLVAALRSGQPVLTARPAEPPEEPPDSTEALVREALATPDFLGAGQG